MLRTRAARRDRAGPHRGAEHRPAPTSSADGCPGSSGRATRRSPARPAPVPPRGADHRGAPLRGLTARAGGHRRRGAGSHCPPSRHPSLAPGTGARSPGGDPGRSPALGAGPGRLPAPRPARAEPHRAGPRGTARPGRRPRPGDRRGHSTSSASAAPTTPVWWASPAWARRRWSRAWPSGCSPPRASWAKTDHRRAVDMRDLLAGTQLRGSLSERLNGLKDEMRRADGRRGRLHRRDPHPGRRRLHRRGRRRTRPTS